MQPNDDPLARLRGKRVSRNVKALGDVPLSISTIRDSCLYQRTNEAWSAASRLFAALNYLELFNIAKDLKVSISDEIQQTITSVFPELSTMQIVLDHLAPLPEKVLEGQPFPAQQLTDLIGTLFSLIRRYGRALIAMEVNSTTFSPNSETHWCPDVPIRGDFTESPPIVELPNLFPLQLRTLMYATAQLMKQLEITPSTVLNFPKQFGPNLQPGTDTSAIRAPLDDPAGCEQPTTSCRDPRDEQLDTSEPQRGGTAGIPVPEYVTLDRMAALVCRSKRTLEKLKKRNKNPLPNPDVEGGGGKPAEWRWDTIRPWLEQEYGRTLPEQFPSARFQDGRAERN